jgi:hypothetical protein
MFVSEKCSAYCAVRAAPFNVTQFLLATVPTVPTVSATYSQLFLLTFAKPRKATIDLVMPVRSPLRPHEVTLLPLDRFSLNFMAGISLKSVQKIQI